LLSPLSLHDALPIYILSYRLYWFEDVEPRRYPWCSLAAVTTHDLPTIAGVLAGSDAPTDLAVRLAPFASHGNNADVVVEVYRRRSEEHTSELQSREK